MERKRDSLGGTVGAERATVTEARDAAAAERDPALEQVDWLRHLRNVLDETIEQVEAEAKKHTTTPMQRAPPRQGERPPVPAHVPRLQRIIRLADLPAYVGLRRTQIDELIRRGEFPRSIPLSDFGRAKGWIESELMAWQQARIAQRDRELCDASPSGSLSPHANTSLGPQASPAIRRKG
jgi:prophage regulatory protein